MRTPPLSLVEAVNQQRGIILQSAYSQENFEINFIKDFTDLESEVITIRDMQKIKRKLQDLQAVLIIPKDQQSSRYQGMSPKGIGNFNHYDETEISNIHELTTIKKNSVKTSQKPSIKDFGSYNQ